MGLTASGRSKTMAGFDPFANQGGPVAWDPEHPDHSKEVADELLARVEDTEGLPPDSGEIEIDNAESDEGLFETGVTESDETP